MTTDGDGLVMMTEEAYGLWMMKVAFYKKIFLSLVFQRSGMLVEKSSQ